MTSDTESCDLDGTGMETSDDDDNNNNDDDDECSESDCGGDSDCSKMRIPQSYSFSSGGSSSSSDEENEEDHPPQFVRVETESITSSFDNVEMLQINVKIVGKETSTETFLINPEASVEDLKRAIENEHSIPMERQRLIYFGKLLVDNTQMLGSKGVQMRLNVVNFVHLSPLPEGALPCIRPPITKKEGENGDQHQSTAIPTATRINRENDIDSTDSPFASNVDYPTTNNQARRPTPSLSLASQLARARRLGALAQERRRRRRLDAYPYRRIPSHNEAMVQVPDEALSACPPGEERLRRPTSAPSSRPPRRYTYLDPRPVVVPSPHSRHHPLLSSPAASFASRRAERLGGALAASGFGLHHPHAYYPRHLPLSPGSGLWTEDSRWYRDRLDGIYPYSSTAREGAPLDDVDDINDDLVASQPQPQQQLYDPIQRTLIQQTRRSALQLLPAVAELHAQLEQLSQLSSSVEPVDDTLVQETLEQMDIIISHHWTCRLRPLLTNLQDPTPTELWSSSIMARPWLSSPWLARPRPTRYNI